MKKLKKLYIVVLAALVVVSCKNPFADRDLIARVGKAKLYESDVATLFTPGMDPKDSVDLLESYVDMWVKRELKTQEAETKFKVSEGSIEKQVEEYRSALLSHKLDKYYVNKLDTLFCDSTIMEYYEQNRADFLLNRPLVKGRVVVFPEDFRQKRELRELITKTDEKLQDFRDISLKNKFELTEFDSWTDYNTFLELLPVSRLSDNDYLLDEEKVIELSDGENVYLAYLTDVLRAGEPNPVERVENAIRRVLFNQRKQDVIRQYEDSLYRAATADKRIEILLDNKKR